MVLDIGSIGRVEIQVWKKENIAIYYRIIFDCLLLIFFKLDEARNLNKILYSSIYIRIDCSRIGTNCERCNARIMEGFKSKSCSIVDKRWQVFHNSRIRRKKKRKISKKIIELSTSFDCNLFKLFDVIFSSTIIIIDDFITSFSFQSKKIKTN